MIYIGAHSTDKLNDNYMGSGTELIKNQQIHGISNFKKEILFIYDNPYDMYKKEWELVDETFINRSDTYNIVLGGKCYINTSPFSLIYVYNNNNKKIGISINSYEWQWGIYESCSMRKSRLKFEKEHSDKIYNPTIIVNNGKINKSIKLSSLKKYKEKGWIRGKDESLKMNNYEKRRKKLISPCGEYSMFFYGNDIQDKLNKGWKYKHNPNPLPIKKQEPIKHISKTNKYKHNPNPLPIKKQEPIKHISKTNKYRNKIRMYSPDENSYKYFHYGNIQKKLDEGWTLSR